MMHRGRLRRAMLGALAVVGLCAPGAEAAGWAKPAVLVSGDRATLLATAVGPDGTLRAAITDASRHITVGLTDATDPSAFSDPLIALRAPTQVTQVALAGDGSGVAVVAVARDRPSSVVGFDAAGALQPPLVVDDAGDTTVAVSPGGAAVTAWVAKSGKSYEIDAAFRDPGSATFGAPMRAGYTTGADALIHAGIGERGEATVMWQANGFPSAVAAAVRQPGAGFAKARYVSRGAIDAQLAVGAGGQAIVVAPQDRELDVAVKAPGASSMPSARRIDRADEGFAAAATAGGQRQVAMAWIASAAEGGHARLRVYAGATTDSGPRRVATLGGAVAGDRIGLAVGPSGTTVASWQEELRAKHGSPEARSHLGVAYRAAGGRFGPTTFFGPVSLDDTPEAVQVAADGRAYVLYEAFESGDTGADAYRRIYATVRGR
jgi:hypothetical protein